MIGSENRFTPSDQVRGQAFSGSCALGLAGRFCRCDGAFFAPLPTLCVAGQHPVLLAPGHRSACPERASVARIGPVGTILSSVVVFL